MPATNDDLTPADVNGSRGWYAAVGDGPPVVFLASPFALARTYREPARHLARSFRVVTVEMPGSGHADRVPRPWGVAEYAAWAAGFLDHLDVTDATLIGHSHSGATALAVAARFPGRVGRVVLVGSVGALAPHSLLRVLAGRVIDAALELRTAAVYWPDLVFNVWHHARNNLHLTPDSLRIDATADAGKVTVPTLVAWGKWDHIMPPRCAAEFARLLPDPTVYYSPRGTHEWCIARPAEFAAAVEAFIARTVTAPA
jgi:pimeloyl-ACP methyl ester carboxylesterase